MTQLRLDKIVLASMLDTYVNYATLTGSIPISGTVANGATVNFTTTLAYTRTKTRADIYARNTTTGIKRPLSGGSRQSPYVPKSTETCSTSAAYNGSIITVTFSVFNGTGASITLTTQTMEITAVLYEVPYTQ